MSYLRVLEGKVNMDENGDSYGIGRLISEAPPKLVMEEKPLKPTIKRYEGHPSRDSAVTFVCNEFQDQLASSAKDDSPIGFRKDVGDTKIYGPVVLRHFNPNNPNEKIDSNNTLTPSMLALVNTYFLEKTQIATAVSAVIREGQTKDNPNANINPYLVFLVASRIGNIRNPESGEGSNRLIVDGVFRVNYFPQNRIGLREEDWPSIRTLDRFLLTYGNSILQDAIGTDGIDLVGHEVRNHAFYRGISNLEEAFGRYVVEFGNGKTDLLIAHKQKILDRLYNSMKR